MSTALEAVNLGKRYRHNQALRDCSLVLPAGRVAALVEPNGAGKTYTQPYYYVATYP